MISLFTLKMINNPALLAGFDKILFMILR